MLEALVANGFAEPRYSHVLPEVVRTDEALQERLLAASPHFYKLCTENMRRKHAIATVMRLAFVDKRTRHDLYLAVPDADLRVAWARRAAIVFEKHIIMKGDVNWDVHVVATQARLSRAMPRF